jgi:hypothetical protein
MSWYDYLACFIAGMFLANVVPYLVHGISGEPFPTPFARPLVKELSYPTANVAWPLVTLVVGYVLFCVGKVSSGDGVLAAFFAGIVALSVWLSVLFARDKPQFQSLDHIQLAKGANHNLRPICCRTRKATYGKLRASFRVSLYGRRKIRMKGTK